MATVSGDAKLRVGSEDPLTWQLLEDDGVTPINLTGITVLTLRMKNRSTGAVKLFIDPKFTVTDAANGKVKLEQVAADFPAVATFEFYISFKDSAGKPHAVPDSSKNYIFRVGADIT